MSSEALAVVTGATGAIGGAIARGLCEHGYRLVVVARDAVRGERAVAGLAKLAPGAARCELCDVGRHRDVVALGERIGGSVEVLVNNAAECPPARKETPEGIERQWATNVLGYFWMMQALAPALAASGRGRVINVASYWAGGLELDDVEFRRRRYDNDTAYRQSKQADRMLSAAFAVRFRDKQVSVNACHPGDVRSKLSTDLGFGGHQTPEQGADTPVWLATSDEVAGMSGQYFALRRRDDCSFAADRDAVERLFELCAGYA